MFETEWKLVDQFFYFWSLNINYKGDLAQNLARDRCARHETSTASDFAKEPDKVPWSDTYLHK